MNKKTDLAENALNYHSSPVAGKIEVISTKPCDTQDELSLAYTPGVAVPCLAIKDLPENAYKYTAKGNLVAVISNGTAVLGLGNIGAMAGKPVMEGKGILFKKFADIDVFDIELNSENTDDIIKTCQMLEPTFGGINLEDIKAPECFIIEEELKRTMKIPVFHDDQHGTAIVGGAALLNALKAANKKIKEVKVVMNGAGASGLAIAQLIVNLGVKKENLILCDTNGVIYKGREKGMNKYKEKFATESSCRTLAEAVNGADVLYGLSKKGAFSDEMIKSMAQNPIIFAMANPDPEITPEEVSKIRNDAIMATGRSDYPNQINNVMCFPFLFRGALDVRTTIINEEMKIAAAYAIAELAHTAVPDEVSKAYNGKNFTFGKEYILPTPFDPRLLTAVSMAVARAAMDTGVAEKPIKDFDEYRLSLEARMNPAKNMLLSAYKQAKKNKGRIGFAFADKEAVLSAAAKFHELKLGTACLIGDTKKIKKTADILNISLENMVIIDPETYKDTDKIIHKHYEKYWRSGLTQQQAAQEIKHGHYNRFAGAVLNNGDIDAFVGYALKDLETTLAAVADTVDLSEDYYTASSSVLLANKHKSLIIADPALYTEQDEEYLSEVILQTADICKVVDIEPNIAVISNGCFGKSLDSEEIMEAINLAKQANPKLKIEGDLDLKTALTPALAKSYPYTNADGNANVLIFSNAQAADAAIKSLKLFGGFKICAKVIQGFSAPVQIAENNALSEEIFNLAVIAAANI